MKYALFCFLLLIDQAAIAQKIRFTDTTNSWVMLEGTPEDRTFRSIIHYAGLLEVNGHRFLRIPASFFGPGPVAVREDTALGILYFVYNALDSTEQILFDYSLKLGDSLAITRGNSRWIHGVTRLDSVQIGSYFYRVWTMNPAGSSGSSNPPYAQGYTFIEGIGSTYGPAFSAYPTFFPGCVQLRCFYHQNNNEKVNPAFQLPCINQYVSNGPLPVKKFDNESSCLFTPVGINRPLQKMMAPIHPNPGGSESILEVPASIGSYSMTITDALGRTLVHVPFEKRMQLPIGSYVRQPGIYYFLVQPFNSGQGFRGKFVFE